MAHNGGHSDINKPLFIELIVLQYILQIFKIEALYN